MENIIKPIDNHLIINDLDGKLLCKTKKAGNEIYIFNAHNAPNIMKEIGRLRELSFRSAGGGSGKSYDLDEFDFLDRPFEQLVVYNPDNQEIIGGYRFQHLANIEFKNGEPNIPMSHIFSVSEKFLTDYAPHTIELGRAFIQPKYQSARMKLKSLFSLDNLWDGIGAMVSKHTEIQYLIGKVTIYPQMKPEARFAIMYFLAKFFSDKEKLFFPKNLEKVPLDYSKKLEKLFNGNNLKENFKILNIFVRKLDEHIPPLIRAYIELSDSMRTFGTVIDNDFGHIHDTGLMITIDDIYEDKKKRYLSEYRVIKNTILQKNTLKF
ncbi:MAG: GNAT family N-acetyltransferase [Prevotellaceae bacterium]|jgi:hypothetical protein|nr:GNAT family N-acetyltransferase [Prevotellaceae bacterium]